MSLKKKTINIKLIVLEVLLISIVASVYLYEKEIDLNDSKEQEIITLVKNKTWNTPLEKDIPYNSWDEVSYSVIVKPSNSKIKDIDISNIEKNIEVKNIKINWEDIDKDKLKDLEINKETIIEISWEAKNDKTTNTDELIKVQKEEIEEPIEEEILKEIKKIDDIKLSQTDFSANINNLLEIRWSNLDQIKFVTIWEKSFTPTIKDGIVYVWIDSWLFRTWSNFVIFQLNDWSIYTHDEQINFIYSDSKVFVSNITPNKFANDIDRNIVLQWQWFSKVISIQLSNNLILKNTNFNVINNNVMSVLIPKELSIGKYKLNIMDTNWIYKSDIEIEITN